MSRKSDAKPKLSDAFPEVSDAIAALVRLIAANPQEISASLRLGSLLREALDALELAARSANEVPPRAYAATDYRR